MVAPPVEDQSGRVTRDTADRIIRIESSTDLLLLRTGNLTL